jgi:hypothetical protein
MNIRGLKYSVPMLDGRRFLVVVVSFLVVGCTKANPSATCNDGTCTDPNFAYCDADGSVGGVPGDCVAVSCTPGEIKECRGDAAFTCNAAGNGYESVPCDLGCGAAPTPHCKYLQPKYLPGTCDTPSTAGDLVISSSGTLDPNLDNVCNGGVVDQTGAPSICVVRNESITITSDSITTIAGLVVMTGRPIAFVADRDIDVAGTIDASGHLGINGPGGGAFASGAMPTSDVSTKVGEGGAGGATNGGNGSTATSTGGGEDGGAHDGGPATMNPALLAAIYGGASTFRTSGAADDTYFAGGGGAVLLVSCHGTVSVSGAINVGGGGGLGGNDSFLPLPAIGGGAGGNVVIQGQTVSITGQLFANGGSGGGGWHADGSTGLGGSDALLDNAPALGRSPVDGAGKGGNGGYGTTPPTDGTHPTQNPTGPAGGGGSVGFLQTYTPNGVTATLTPSKISPPLQPNGIVETR